MILTQIQLTEEQYRALKEIAETREVSMAKLIRESVAQYIITNKHGLTHEEKRQRALEFLERTKTSQSRASKSSHRTGFQPVLR